MKNGWHIIGGSKVYVEDGRITHGVAGEGYTLKTTYPYRKCKDGWDREYDLTVEAFRAGARRGTICMR